MDEDKKKLIALKIQMFKKLMPFIEQAVGKARGTVHQSIWDRIYKRITDDTIW